MVSLDQFYTRPEVAQQCIQSFSRFYSWDLFDIVLEPSAGTGSFYNLLTRKEIWM